jgi:hypothetical protein
MCVCVVCVCVCVCVVCVCVCRYGSQRYYKDSESNISHYDYYCYCYFIAMNLGDVMCTVGRLQARRPRNHVSIRGGS